MTSLSSKTAFRPSPTPAAPARAVPSRTAGRRRPRAADDWPSRCPPCTRRQPAVGRCEVVCYTSDHNASLAALPPERMRTVLEAWVDRTVALSALPGVEQVFCFENYGKEIGVTLRHPHGQIYAYPFVTPRDPADDGHRARLPRANLAQSFRGSAGRGDCAAVNRIVARTEHWTAFVPFAAHWPLEVHLYPNRQVTEPARAERGGAHRISATSTSTCCAGWRRSTIHRSRTSPRGIKPRSASTANSAICTSRCTPRSVHRASSSTWQARRPPWAPSSTTSSARGNRPRRMPRRSAACPGSGDRSQPLPL